LHPEFSTDLRFTRRRLPVQRAGLRQARALEVQQPDWGNLELPDGSLASARFITPNRCATPVTDLISSCPCPADSRHIGHPVAYGYVQEPGVQTGLRQVFGPDAARHQRVRPGHVAGVEDAEQHLSGPLGQPLRPQVVHHQPGRALAHSRQVLGLPTVEAVPDHGQQFRGRDEEHRATLGQQVVGSRGRQVGLAVPGGLSQRSHQAHLAQFAGRMAARGAGDELAEVRGWPGPGCLPFHLVMLQSLHHDPWRDSRWPAATCPGV